MSREVKIIPMKDYASDTWEIVYVDDDGDFIDLMNLIRVLEMTWVKFNETANLYGGHVFTAQKFKVVFYDEWNARKFMDEVILPKMMMKKISER